MRTRRLFIENRNHSSSQSESTSKHRHGGIRFASVLNDSGFGLIEVIIATAILGVIALSASTLVVQSQNGVNSAKFRQDSDVFAQEVRTALSNANSCANTFAPLGITATASTAAPITDIRDGSVAPGVVLYSTGQIYGDRTLRLAKMTLGKFIAGSTSGNAIMTLSLQLDTTKTASGPQNLGRDVTLTVALDSSGLVTGCSSLGTSSSLWLPVNVGAGINIYFQSPAPGGFVGIDTAVPGATLDVFGGMRAMKGAPLSGNISNKGYAFNLDGDTGMFAVNNETLADGSDLTIFNDGIEKMRIANTGNIGIGTAVPQTFLDIGGTTTIRSPLNTTGSIGFDTGPLLTFASNHGSGTGQEYLRVALENIPPPNENIVIRNPFTNTLGLDSYFMAFKLVHPFVLGEQVQMFGGLNNGPNDRLTIGKGSVEISSGSIGVGKPITATTFQVDASSDINTDSVYRIGGNIICQSTGCTPLSDISLKTGIEPIGKSLEKILQLRGVSYDWKDQKKFGSKRQIGFIAQEVESVFPEVVNKDSMTGLKSVAYDHLAAPIVESLRELFEKIKALQASSASEDQRVAKLEQRIRELEARDKLVQIELEKLRTAVFKTKEANPRK